MYNRWNSGMDELYHWKYIDKKKVGDKWRYIYKKSGEVANNVGQGIKKFGTDYADQVKTAVGNMKKTGEEIADRYDDWTRGNRISNYKNWTKQDLQKGNLVGAAQNAGNFLKETYAKFKKNQSKKGTKEAAKAWLKDFM